MGFSGIGSGSGSKFSDFGGFRKSGIGRENSLEALRHYSQIKTVYVETGDVASPY